jgi:tetratricopeptide (TPR) repeat protein
VQRLPTGDEDVIQRDNLATPKVQARALRGLAQMTQSLGEHARARTLLDEALMLYRQVGDEDGVAKCLNNLGALVWRSEGDLERATALFEESVALLKRLAENRVGQGVAVPLSNLAQIAEVRGDFAEARRLAEESLAAARVEKNDVGGRGTRRAGLASTAREPPRNRSPTRGRGTANRAQHQRPRQHGFHDDRRATPCLP